MTSTIKAIQKDVVHKICSGQVVLNLATAIKELVENSLDAQATAIEVRLKEYGSDTIEVIDNGTGIHPDNFQALTLKHHTSKLNDFSDLLHVETFGFRGEALSSLCALGDITVITRHESEKYGTKLTFDYLGILQNKEPCARQIGTTITITNLFSSLPVRQKEFHRNLKKEFTKAVQILSAYALISTKVKLNCVNQTKNGRLTFLSTNENKNIRDNISCVFGPKQLSSLLEIVTKPPSEEILQEFNIKKYTSDMFTLEGFISSCYHGSGRSSTDRQFYFINNRPCEPSKVMKLVNEIYHQYNSHQFPFVLMNILVPRQSIDVNVTPDKRMIFLQNESLLLATVKATLLSLFENIPSTYKINNPLPASLPAQSTEISQKKFSLSSLDKWRHSKDKNTDKRSNEFSERRPIKQMKLESYRISSVSSTEVSIEQDEDLKEHADSSLQPDETSIIDDTVLQIPSIVEVTSNTVGVTEQSLTCTKNISNIDTSSIEEKSVSSLLNDVCTFESNPITEECMETDESDYEVKPNQNNIQQLSDHERETETIKMDIETSEYRDGRKSVTLQTSLENIRRIFHANKKRENRKTIVNRFHAEIDPSKNQLAEEELNKVISKDMFLKMDIIGQFNLGFIITKLDDDLFIVDQHATDEKYNFETLQRTTTLKCQKLVVPQSLDLTVTNECTLIDNIEVLKKNGFEFSVDYEAPATKRVKLVSIPVSYNWQFGKDDIDEMLFMLQDAPNTLCRPSRIRAMFASRACRKSVMIGTALSTNDMRRLIRHMSEIEHPWNCPHGRPTMRHLINLSLLE